MGRISCGRSEHGHPQLRNREFDSRLMASDFEDRAVNSDIEAEPLSWLTVECSGNRGAMQPMKRAKTMDRFRRVGFLIAMGGLAAIARATSGHAAEACASLKDLKVENTTITAAESVPAGIVHRAQLEELRQSACLLPGDGHPIARARFGDPHRNVASAGGMEGRLRGNRKRRLQRRFQLPHSGGGFDSRLRRRQH